MKAFHISVVDFHVFNCVFPTLLNPSPTYWKLKEGISDRALYLNQLKNWFGQDFGRTSTQLVSWFEYFVISSFILSGAGSLSSVTADLIPLILLYIGINHIQKTSQIKAELHLLGVVRQDTTSTKRKVFHPPAGWHCVRALTSSRFLLGFSIVVLLNATIVEVQQNGFKVRLDVVLSNLI